MPTSFSFSISPFALLDFLYWHSGRQLQKTKNPSSKIRTDWICYATLSIIMDRSHNSRSDFHPGMPTHPLPLMPAYSLDTRILLSPRPQWAICRTASPQDFHHHLLSFGAWFGLISTSSVYSYRLYGLDIYLSSIKFNPPEGGPSIRLSWTSLLCCLQSLQE